MMVGAYTNLQGALLNLMEALVAAYIVKVGRPAPTRSVFKRENQSIPFGSSFFNRLEGLRCSRVTS